MLKLSQMKTLEDDNDSLHHHPTSSHTLCQRCRSLWHAGKSFFHAIRTAGLHVGKPCCINAGAGPSTSAAHAVLLMIYTYIYINIYIYIYIDIQIYRCTYIYIYITLSNDLCPNPCLAMCYVLCSLYICDTQAVTGAAALSRSASRK